MDIDWTSLRTLDGSQRTAFEELCCQLAAREQVPQGSKFTRVGAPDAGRECYWVLPNGDKWAWQAKFFVSPPDDAQWQQIDESVKTALDKESRIVSYTICTPLDRQDPKIDNQLWFQDKWDLHLAKWNSWAAERGLSIEFDYWGKHEIFLRLSQEAHQGRYFFWFNKEYFSNSWFSERLDEAIANAGPRYTPELNVALPIAHILDGLARTPDFFKKLDSEAAKAKKAFRSASSRLASEVAKHEYDVLESDIKNLLDKLQSEKKSIGRIDWDALKELIVVIQKDIQQCIEHLEQVGKEKAEDAVKEQPERQKEFADYERYHLRDLSHQLYSLESTIHGTEAQAANTAALLVTGKAGTGKTHLFCDVAKQRLLADQPTVMLLGEQFRDSEPWSQIINLLGFACSRDQFLGALDASAEGRGQRALILIDALNEGEGKRFWRQHLAGMLATLAKYEWLSIAVSVRSSYEDVVIPENLVSNKLVRVEHVGFADHEYEAVKTFFDYYGVERPSIPILSPEFSNPLFLKLFCKGLRNSGYTRIPEGLQGITVIFDFFLDSLNEKLSKPDRLDFNSKARPIHVAVSALAEAMASKEERWLSHTEAQSIIDRILPPKGYETSLFRQLIAEGLLAEDRFLTIDEVMKTHQSIDGIRFAYERSLCVTIRETTFSAKLV